MDLVPLGMRWYYTLLKVKQMNESAEKDLIKHIKNIPGIFYLIRGVGNYDLCFETHCRSPKELEAILHELHASFGATIKKVDNVEILEEYKCDFFPYLMKVTNV
jgi:DNA-binding Lrp family transcriptional regulator